MPPGGPAHCTEAPRAIDADGRTVTCCLTSALFTSTARRPAARTSAAFECGTACTRAPPLDPVGDDAGAGPGFERWGGERRRAVTGSRGGASRPAGTSSAAHAAPQRRGSQHGMCTLSDGAPCAAEECSAAPERILARRATARALACPRGTLLLRAASSRCCSNASRPPVQPRCRFNTRPVVMPRLPCSLGQHVVHSCVAGLRNAHSIVLGKVQ